MSAARDSVHCIGCGSARLNPVGVISTTQLQEGYRRLLSLNVSRLLSDVTAVTEHHCLDCDLLMFLPPLIGDEEFYGDLAKRPWYYMNDKPEFLVAKSRIPGGSSVLEIGGGTGSFARHVGLQNYVGLEYSTAAVTAARASGIEMLNQPLDEHVKSISRCYDFACSFQVLEHVSNPLQFVREMAAAIREGGRVVISVPSEEGFAGAAINDFLNLPPHHVTRWTDEALRSIAKNSGLTLEGLIHEDVAPYHAGWFLSVQVMRALGGSFCGRAGSRINVGFPHFLVWRALALASSAIVRLVPGVGRWLRSRGPSVGHTVVAIMRK